MPRKRTYTFPNGLGTYPVVEAKMGRVVVVTKADLKHGERRNAFGCALVCSLKRSQGAPAAVVSGTMAYIVTPYKGRLVAMRHSVPPATRAAIVKFDETGRMPKEGFVLGPMRKSSTLDYNYTWWHSHQHRLGKGRTPKGGRRPHKITFRHLTGQVQTNPA